MPKACARRWQVYLLYPYSPNSNLMFDKQMLKEYLQLHRNFKISEVILQILKKNLQFCAV